MGFDLAKALPSFIVVLLSLTVHEFAHAWTAYRLGDDTAARMGRLTLNPLPHIDLIGTIVVPLVLTMAGITPIGWAKPVPVNPANFRRGVKMSTGDTLVSFAGPISNLGFALVAAIAWGLLLRFAPQLVVRDAPAQLLLQALVVVNVILAIFNLIPLPPLDGSHFVGHVLPRSLQEGWERFRAFGPLVLIALLYIPAGRGGPPLLWTVLGPARDFVLSFYSLVINGLAA